MGLVGFFMVVECVVGLWAGSLALVADAGHMLSDLAALILTWIALKVSHNPPSVRFSYGSHRVQMLVAFVNGLTMLAMAGWIIFEAITRFFSPVSVQGWPVLLVAILGGLINLYAYSTLHKDTNFAVRSATLHVLWDMIGSIGTVVAAVIILLTNKQWVDPLLSLALSVLLLKATWHIIRDASHVLMEAAPRHIDIAVLKKDLEQKMSMIEDVHHIHVWSLTHDYAVLTLHARLKPHVKHEAALQALTHYLKYEYGLYHTTIQLETGMCMDDIDVEKQRCTN